MEERNVKISLDKAREWYNQGGELKELALSAFTENEITISALPNTWQEFCKMYPIKDDEWYIGTNSNIIRMFQEKRHILYCCNILPSQRAAKAHLAYMQLHQLRDCYRQGWVPDWGDGEPSKYRIKTETKYRPFKDAEECFNEIGKHQPFGYIKYKDRNYYYPIRFGDNSDFDYLFENRIFADGTPFGIKENE